MVAIICTSIICLTITIESMIVLMCVNKLAGSYFVQKYAQQPSISQEDLEKAYKEAATENIPDFQDVIAFINKEFTGVAEDEDE